MGAQATCIHCGQHVMFPDPNVTIDDRTICTKCLKRNFPKASRMLRAYNRRNRTNRAVTLAFTPATTRRPPIRSD